MEETQMAIMRKRPRRVRGCVVAVAVASMMTLGGNAPARAAAGDLDASFGAGGIALAAFPGGSFAKAIAVQPDGKIVVVGAAAGSSRNGEFAVARFDTAGVLDPTFGTGGMLTTRIALGANDEARSVAIQPDAKIVVAGTPGGRRIAVVRYLPNGTLDPSFSGNGIVRNDLTPGVDVGFDVALQPNGKIVVAGVENGPIRPRFAIVRYLRDGTLDGAFGDGGVVTLVHGGVGRALVLQPDGRIVVAGYTPYGLTVVRLLPSGDPDRSFAGDGVVGRIVHHAAHVIWPLAVALQSNGKILVGGGWDIFDSGLARLMPDGRLDRTFGGDGAVRIRLGSNEQAIVGLAVQADGRIVAAGHVEPHEAPDSTVPHIVVARALRSGALDDTWGGDGRVGTRLPGGASCGGVALQEDGRILVAGEQMDPWSIAVVRYLP
jgi:uncharacterized delta-60 repeat protein